MSKRHAAWFFGSLLASTALVMPTPDPVRMQSVALAALDAAGENDPERLEVSLPVAIVPVDVDPILVAGIPGDVLAREELRLIEKRPDLPKVGELTALRGLIKAIRADDRGQIDAARKALGTPLARAFADWIELRTSTRPIAFEPIRAFLAAHPDWPSQNVLRRRAEAALYTDRHPSATVKAFFGTRVPLSVQGRILLATELLEEGRTSDARALITAAWRKELFGATIEGDILKRFPDMLTTADHRARMERLLLLDRFGDATRSAERAGKDYLTLIRLRQAVERKATDVQALLAAVPAALKGDSSVAYSMAQHFRRKNKPDDAASALAKAPRDADVLANGDEWWAERRMIARKLLDAGAFEKAYEVVRNHAGETEAARVEAEFHAGWIALRFLSDPIRAGMHFSALAASAQTPQAIARAGYWQGRTAQALGDDSGAQTFYRDAAAIGASYYGQLARERMGEQQLAFPVVTRGRHHISELEATDTIRALRLLYALGDTVLTHRFLADIALGSEDHALMDHAGEIAAEHDDARGLLVLGKIAGKRGFALDRHAFPLSGLPSAIAPELPVDLPVVYAIARQESAFDVAAVSHAGARGFMQLMPATARTTAARFKIPFDVARLTRDGAYNLRIGSAHLSELFGDWRGSYILTFAAYNAGAGNVKKWIEAYGDPRDPAVDPVDWVERIPFSETRDYVQRVMENYQIYRVRFGRADGISIAADLRKGARATPEIDPFATP